MPCCSCRWRCPAQRSSRLSWIGTRWAKRRCSILSISCVSTRPTRRVTKRASLSTWNACWPRRALHHSAMRSSPREPTFSRAFLATAPSGRSCSWGIRMLSEYSATSGTRILSAASVKTASFTVAERSMTRITWRPHSWWSSFSIAMTWSSIAT